MSKAEDLGAYYRLPSDNRELNYEKYFTEGESIVPSIDSYNSQNTKRLCVDELKDILINLDFIKRELSQ